jgi:hypothetical protein
MVTQSIEHSTPGEVKIKDTDHDRSALHVSLYYDSTMVSQ